MKYMLPAGTYAQIRQDVKWRTQLVHDFNQHRTASNFVLLFNMCWWLIHNHDYYADTPMREAVADCELALQQFDKERHGEVSVGTLLKLAVRISALGEMLLDVRADHYRKAADAAFEFDQRSRGNEISQDGCADSDIKRKASHRLRCASPAKNCYRYSRRVAGGAASHCGGGNQPSSRPTA